MRLPVPMPICTQSLPSWGSSGSVLGIVTATHWSTPSWPSAQSGFVQYNVQLDSKYDRTSANVANRPPNQAACTTEAWYETGELSEEAL